VQVSLSDEAQADADAAIGWYIGEGALVAADDFVNELDQALSLLGRFPEIGKTAARKTRTLSLHSRIR
jgi:plasmid stabilization system protein ParE